MGDARRALLRKVVERWRVRHPNEVVSLDRECRQKRADMKRKTGLSDGGCFAELCVVPPRVYFMAEKLAPGFWKDGGYDAWIAEFPQFHVKPPK